MIGIRMLYNLCFWVSLAVLSFVGGMVFEFWRVLMGVETIVTIDRVEFILRVLILTTVGAIVLAAICLFVVLVLLMYFQWN